MQLKGFLWGAAVASLAWLGMSAIADRGEAVHGVAVLEASAPHGMTAEEKQAHVAEMQQLWRAMTPAQREAHRGMMRCPYSGQSGSGYDRGQAGEWDKGVGRAGVPVEI